ncbi:MAG TPA: tRNA 2-thiouridine(34) synthase MnmA [Dissulfurispiraceae bacterium]|nr:tRNA 2-thiouridine(34) synthase MnmA [Dissulfurispiraceae bacterium]
MSSVVVGMSGGVDSSVAAFLLKQQGHRVLGVSFLLYEARLRSQYADAPCCSLASIEDAGKTAALLGVEHEVINLRDIFLAKVIEPFIAAYEQGKTPNPCILCNRFIKFPYLLKYADAHGAQYIATGHYARVSHGASGRAELKKGLDPKKDQSYALYDLGQDILQRLKLPLGGLQKDETREIAHSLNLPAALRPESQDICFVDDGDYGTFVDRLAHHEPGPIVDLESGRTVGRHRGLHLYTIGQRKRLPALGRPVYVVRLDTTLNALFIGPREMALTLTCCAGGLRWIVPPGDFAADAGHFRATAKIRSTMPDEPAHVVIEDDGATITFDQPQWAPAPGQSAVLYDDDRVLGGGVIRNC